MRGWRWRRRPSAGPAQRARIDELNANRIGAAVPFAQLAGRRSTEAGEEARVDESHTRQADPKPALGQVLRIGKLMDLELHSASAARPLLARAWNQLPSATLWRNSNGFAPRDATIAKRVRHPAPAGGRFHVSDCTLPPGPRGGDWHFHRGLDGAVVAPWQTLCPGAGAAGAENNPGGGVCQAPHGAATSQRGGGRCALRRQ